MCLMKLSIRECGFLLFCLSLLPGGRPDGCDQGVIITEVMYNPAPADFTNEWLEIVNFGCESINLERWTIEDLSAADSDLLFPVNPGDDMMLGPGEYALIVDSDSTVTTIFSVAPGTKIFRTDDAAIARGLNNNADTVIIRDSNGFEVTRVEYNDKVGSGCGNAADNGGFSLERISPYGSNTCDNFQSDGIEDGGFPTGGTPGSLNYLWDPNAPDPKDCPRICDPGIIDDPHIKTWGGKWFDFHGECDLVLLKGAHIQTGTTVLDLDIHVRTIIRRDYSYITNAALRIGQSILEVASFGQYFLNGISNANWEGMELEGFPLLHEHPNPKQHVFTVVLGPYENITLSSFKDMVSVRIHAGSQAHFGDSVGLMGTYHHHEGKMVARDNTTVLDDDPIAFGQEWQVRDSDPQLFMAARDPQYPQKCLLPSDKKVSKETSRRRLGESVTRGAAEDACAYLAGKEQRDACIFDVMATGDVDIAQGGAY